MQDDYDILCLSPHLDDAALSCGGYLASRASAGAKILIYTVAAAGPTGQTPITEYARRFMERCGLTADGGALRRAEDAAACAVMGVAYRHGDMLESIFRTNPVTGSIFYPDHKQVFGPPVPEEDGVPDRLAAQFRALPSAREILAPLSVGGHVDHRLVRAAAERCFGSRLRYYEDYPYAGKWLAVWKRTRPRKAWRVQVFALDAQAQEARLNALDCYASQVAILFGNRPAMIKHTLRYVRRAGGERFWETRANAGAPTAQH